MRQISLAPYGGGSGGLLGWPEAKVNAPAAKRSPGSADMLYMSIDVIVPDAGRAPTPRQCAR